MTQLSRHFTLAELTASQIAARRGLDNTPGDAEANQLRRLCALILEPLRVALDRPVVVTSGYRSREVNALVGGAKNSHHLSGRAADIQVPGMTPIEVCRAIAEAELPFDQLIHEFGDWCHVSVALDQQDPPRTLLTARVVDGRVEYQQGLWA